MIKVPFFSLKEQHQQLNSRMHEILASTINSSHFILGEELSNFESEFSKYCETKYCIGVANGLDALRIGLEALGIGRGDEVIVPNHTFIATAFAVSQTGATPIFISPDHRTFNIDINKIEEKITSRTKAILPVHLYGTPCKMDQIAAIAEKHSLFVIEDFAQSHGAMFEGKKVGSFSSLGCTSFYPTKNLGCLGDGGAIVTSDLKLYERCLKLRNYGSNKKYVHDLIGWNSRLDELQAAFLTEKLKYLDRWNEQRRTKADLYRNLLSDCKSIRFQEVPADSLPVYHLLVVQTQNRTDLQAHLKDAGIETAIHYPSLVSDQNCYSISNRSKTPSADEGFCGSLLSLPLFPELELEKIEYVAKKIKEFYS